MTAYEAYLSLRDEWNWIVLQREKADLDEKDSMFERLARSWRRLSESERRCAGMHACIVYHGSEK